MRLHAAAASEDEATGRVGPQPDTLRRTNLKNPAILEPRIYLLVEFDTAGRSRGHAPDRAVRADASTRLAERHGEAGEPVPSALRA